MYYYKDMVQDFGDSMEDIHMEKEEIQEQEEE